MVCRVRLRYAKRGKLRFTSHRDVARAFERALRRAGLPIAYSQGYSPHPKVSWVGAAPTGAASEAEYAEIQLVTPVDPEVVRAELDAALPEGLAVLDAVLTGAGARAGDGALARSAPARTGPAGAGKVAGTAGRAGARGAVGAGGLAERIEASQWRIEVPGISTDQLRQAVTALLAAPEVLVERVTKDGRRSVDARAAIVSLVVEDCPVQPPGSDHFVGCGILLAVVRQVSPAVRPDDVLSALSVVAGFRPLAPARATRMAQGRLDDGGGLVDPLAPDREPARIAPVDSGGGELVSTAS